MRWSFEGEFSKLDSKMKVNITLIIIKLIKIGYAAKAIYNWNLATT